MDLLYEHLTRPEGPPQTIRVVVADEHQLVREGVKKVLSTEADIALVGEGADLPGTLDVLLLDLSLSPAHELDALPCDVAQVDRSRSCGFLMVPFNNCVDRR